jgi:hypothetical protein
MKLAKELRHSSEAQALSQHASGDPEGKSVDPSPYSRLIELCERLSAATARGIVEWSPQEETAFLSKRRGGSVAIRSRNRDGEEPYELVIYNPKGEKVESLVSEWAPPDDLPARWNPPLADLYRTARRQALGADRVLDDLSAELSPRRFFENWMELISATMSRFVLAFTDLVWLAPRRRAERTEVDQAPRRAPVRPPQRLARVEPPPTAAVRPSPRWGLLPVFALLSGGAVFLIAIANALSRSGRGGGTALFWFAVLAVVCYAAFRLITPEAARSERIGIVILAWITFYFVKIIKDPFLFTYSDEFIHARNAVETLATGRLFGENTILTVTPQYTGLQTVTSAVASLTGLDVFGAGLIVIGAARLIMLLGLFLLFEAVSGSSRVAGLGAFLYAANPNYVFFTAQYAYESLALPLFVLALAGVARWTKRDDGVDRRAWAVVVPVLITAVVITHHMTTYALVACLGALLLVHILFARRSAFLSPWRFVVFAVVTMILWLTFVASETVGYLTPVFTLALESAVQTISREAAPRQLFVNDSGLVVGPWGERVVTLASVALIALAVMIGLVIIRRRYRRHPVALVLAGAAAGYLGTILFRLIPKAWEIGSRASEFLFIGVAFLLAVVFVWVAERGRPRVAQGFLVGASAVLVAGGITAGWPYDLRLGLPYRVAVEEHVLEPQGSTAADWTVSHLGSGQRIGADESNARLLITRRQTPLVGSSPNVGDVILYPVLTPYMVDVLTANDIRYVVMDRRRVRDDKAVGYFFTSRRAEQAGHFPTTWTSKFDRQRGVSRIYDSGDLAIYDVGGLRFDPDFP